MQQVKTSYTPKKSTLETDRAELKIGPKRGEFSPYNLLLGSLSACFHATLSDIFIKRKVELPPIDIIVTGDKRKEVPTTLEWVSLDITVHAKYDEAEQGRFLRSIELAAKYCSIHETISKVAKMSHEVHFK